MATTGLSFGAQVDAWTKKSEARMTAIARQSTQVLYGEIVDNLSGGMVNVRTGFLRASALASLSEMPPIEPSARPAPGASYGSGGGQITATIAGMQLGQTVYVGWTAAYAGLVHDGTASMAPRPYVALPALGWQQIVNSVTAKAKQQVGH